MARYCVVQARAADLELPLAVIAQDGPDVAIASVSPDVVALATRLGLPPLSFVGWVQGKRGAISPLKADDGTPIAVDDPRWLSRFADTGHSEMLACGPIGERTGAAGTVAEAVARELRQVG
jgi:hypothetical protein